MKTKLMVVLVASSLAIVGCGFDEEGEQEVDFQDESDLDDEPADELDAVEVDVTPSTLAEVQHWLYLIDVNLSEETVEQIVASDYDMVVLDFIPSEENNTDYPMAEVVSQLHAAPHPKLVIAYIDVGQAESFRTYWQPDWQVGEPAWIAGEDPDGWVENYPVAFWWDEWRDIWLGDGGLLETIAATGFDGVYLDWIEAYSDESVLQIARDEDVDTVQEVIWWVGDIRDTGRLTNPDFVVIAQNAAELVEFPEYLESIDGLAQEQVWFDGSADDDPPGDCPLPRTEADIDTDAYYDALPPACQNMYDLYPESTLHVSSEEYLYYLNLASQQGIPVFTVDYALQPDNVDWIYETSRQMGFVPFVGNRALDRFVPVYP